MSHLSLTHHKTSKHGSPHKIEGMVEPQKLFEFKFKVRQINYLSHIKSRYWPLCFSRGEIGWRRQVPRFGIRRG
jgi:hypothetical protein